MKKQTKSEEILIKFNKTNDPKKLDEMIYNFEKTIQNNTYNYFLKESENPYIFFIEHPKPEEFIKEINLKETEINEIIPVKCVLNNINYISSLILKKIRHKITYNDTFNIQCHIDSYTTQQTKEELEKELERNIHEITHISTSEDPMWKINVYIIGEISAINITRSNKNRNKFSQYSK